MITPGHLLSSFCLFWPQPLLRTHLKTLSCVCLRLAGKEMKDVSARGRKAFVRSIEFSVLVFGSENLGFNAPPCGPILHSLTGC